ncbi:MAG: hypothetical protein J1F03_10125 [Oscillospiraceae bacterium]|nr:hypothetical protein [Oscillospiraceae bacterium]
MDKNSKTFLRSAIILTIALGVIIWFMNEWGVVQVIIAVLVAALAAGQWALFFYLRKK